MHGHAAVAESHISILFLVGDRVYKVHKAVDFGFLDFTDLNRRREDCHREVDLNRRLAPDVYLGVADVGLDGRPVEHAVVMRRLPADRSLAALVARNAPLDGELDRIADVLAAFHRRATRSPAVDAAATADAQWQRWQSTGEQLSRFLGELVDPEAERELTGLASRYLRGRTPLFAARIAAGGACDGHGDLQAADIFCLDDGPRLLDCLEFDDELRYGDELADVAFLAADLEALGAVGGAEALVDRYEQRAHTGAPRSLVDFYVASRARVRVLVECLRAEQGLPDADPGRPLEVALGRMRRALPRLVLVGGPPGSGKTAAAEWLAGSLGAELLSTDHLRQSVRPGGGYSDTARGEVYRTLAVRARRLLALGRTVVADATWASRSWRAEAARAAAAAASPVVAVELSCPTAERMRRVGERRPGESDATPAVAGALGTGADPWPEAMAVDSSGPAEATRVALRQVLEPVLQQPLGR